jgi:outer membrane protein OmpA-like peptidoglycan-associated protein
LPTPSNASSNAPTAPPSSIPATGPLVDLLTARVGTVLRSWPASSTRPEDPLLGSPGWTAADDTKGPYEFVYELATTGRLEKLEVSLGQVTESSANTIHLAVSSISASSGYRDTGTFQLKGADSSFDLSPAPVARWIKITIDQHGAGTRFYDLRLQGRLNVRTTAPALTGLWRYYSGDPYREFGLPRGSAGTLPPPPNITQLERDDTAIELHQTGTDLVGAICGSHGLAMAFRGQMTATSAKLALASGPLSPAIVNEEGTLLVGVGGEQDWFAMRMPGGGTCNAIAGTEPVGSGTPVMVIFDTSVGRYGPFATPNDYPGYKFVPVVVSAFDQTTLGQYQIAVLSRVCNAGKALTKLQSQALVDWVYSGGKLIIQDSDDCTSTDYGFLPYPFTTSNPGRNAAKGGKLVIVESDSLGSKDKKSPSYVDVDSYIADANQQLGDANLVITNDLHWCGHFYGTNVLNMNGFEQAYAFFGQGLFIYDGFDADDNTIPAYDKITMLELKQAPDAALACSQLVAEPFTIDPGDAPTFDSGKAQEMTIPLSIYASQGYSGAVSVTVVAPAGAPWPATVSNASVPLNGGKANLSMKVGVPASAKPGSYPFTVKATDANGKSATSTVTIASSGAPAAASAARPPVAPVTPKIAPALEKDKRVAVYGIYFDFASAKLKPESTPVLDEIADALNANPSWNLTIEGHTDNVGGADYNLDLSKRRAAAVQDALVTRYHISADRLSTAGFGFTRPKASNDTPEGRALNRRVELVRK